MLGSELPTYHAVIDEASMTLSAVCWDSWLPEGSGFWGFLFDVAFSSICLSPEALPFPHQARLPPQPPQRAPVPSSRMEAPLLEEPEAKSPTPGEVSPRITAYPTWDLSPRPGHCQIFRTKQKCFREVVCVP